MKNFPKQRLSYEEKMANDCEWVRNTIDSLLINHSSDFSLSTKSEYRRMLSNYQLFNNVLNQADFEYECEPLGLEVGQYEDEVKPFNKTYNKIQVLLGEELRRPFKYKAVLTNEDGINSKLVHRDELLKQYVMAQINAVINPEEQQKVLDPAEIQKYMNTTYLDAREMVTNKLLRYYERALDLADKKNDSFKHALISGYEFVYLGAHGDEPTLEVVNPLGVFYHKSPEVKFVQDGLYAGFRTYMTSGDIIDKFGEYLTAEEIEKIDVSRHGRFGDKETSRTFMSNYTVSRHEGSYGTTSSINDWLVQHVEWRSQRRVGFLTVNPHTPDEEMTIVDEAFKAPDYAAKVNRREEYNKLCTYYEWADPNGVTYSLTYAWIPEVWEGVRIGDNIYCMMGPKKHQFRDADNPYKVSLGYHGVTVSSMNAPAISLMDRMKPFQYLFFIVMHKLKRMIAHDRGRIFNLDTTKMDPKLGWDKSLYYLTQMGINFENPLQNADQPGYGQRSAATSTDWSTTDYIANYMQLLQAIDQQISDVAGVNRQREGQALPTEAVTNAQSNIEMSSTITEVYFQVHDKLWEKVLSNFSTILIDCYKGKKVTKQFILDDLSIETINVSPEIFNNAQFGIFVSNSPKDDYVFKSLAALAQPLLQNDKAKFSDIVKMLRTDSTEELEAYITQSEKRAEQALAEQTKMQYDSNERLQAAQHEFELEKQANEIEAKIYIAEIDSLKFQRDQDSDNNNVPDQFEIGKWQEEAKLKRDKLSLEEDKLEHQKEVDKEQLRLKSRQIAKSGSKK